MESEKEMQIGDVAERTGLSLRTIRYYEEEGLIAPAARTAGGFRLYTEADSARLQLIRKIKPLGFSLDETRDLLYILDQLASGPDGPARTALVDRLREFALLADDRRELLREQLAAVDEFAEMLRGSAR